jgi:hypothetical protein
MLCGMRFLGSLLVVTIVLGSAACTRDIAGSPTAGVSSPPPVRESSEAPTASEGITECTDCDSDTIEDAIENPVVARAKRVETPADCDVIMPMSTVNQVVDATARPGEPSVPNECHAEYETADLSRVGQLWLNFSDPVSLEPVTISEFEGNTLLESEISNQVCEYGLALDDAVDKYDHGSWLTLRVMSGNGVPPPCELARRLLEIAFENLPNA